MERTYIRGNRAHWEEVYEWACGEKPKEEFDAEGTCFVRHTCIIIKQVIKQGKNKLFFIDEEDEGDKALCDIVTTNPNWHEVKPWKNKPYEPKPFDKVLGWDENEDVAEPDIFLYKSFGTYVCARTLFNHVKTYNEKEYLKSLEKRYGK